MKTKKKKFKGDNWLRSQVAYDLTIAKPRFKAGDEVVLTSTKKLDYEVADWIVLENIKKGVIYTVASCQGNAITIHHTLHRFFHPMSKFRKVERVKLKPIATDKLKHGDVVKLKENSNQKFVVAYYTKDIVFFHPTGENEFSESDGVIPFMRSYSVIVYKLLNLKDLCK